jgi:signal peptidase
MTTVEPRTPRVMADAPVAKRSDGPKEKSVWAWLWYGISAGLLALILGIAAVAIVVPQMTGAVPLTVLSSSMEPTLRPGTMAVVRPIEQSQLGQIRIGDIITFQPYPKDPTLVTHRVVEIQHLSTGGYVFTTQGDANSTVDEPVRGKQVRATLWYAMPWLGWVNDLVNAQGNRVWIVPTAAGLLFAYAGYTVVAAAVSHAKEKKRKKAEEDDEEDADEHLADAS